MGTVGDKAQSQAVFRQVQNDIAVLVERPTQGPGRKTMQGWKVLAQGGEGIGVSRCPGGHVHLDYGNLTLRFTEEDFRAFAAIVGRAAAALDGTPLLKGPMLRPEDMQATFSVN
jgi:hypothetical protein